MSEFKEAVESILKEHNIELKSLDTFWGIQPSQKYIRDSMYKTSELFESYLNSITSQDIRKILQETDNTAKRTHDLARIKRMLKLLKGMLESYVTENVYFYIPKKDPKTYFKTINELPDVSIDPKKEGAVAGYDLLNDVVHIYALNNDGTYNPADVINLLVDGSIENALIHELTHKIDYKDAKGTGKSFKVEPKTGTPAYSNNENELNAITNQLIYVIDKSLKAIATDIQTNKSEWGKPYPWPNAIQEGINLLLSDIHQGSFGEVLDRMSDDNLHRMYTSIYKYFYKRLLEQYKKNNPDQLNQELKNINKNNPSI